MWKRGAPYPSFINFDANNRLACRVKRPRSNTPLQALTLMNDEQYVEAARHLAERMIKDGGANPETRLVHGFRLATARRPDAGEHRPACGDGVTLTDPEAVDRLDEELGGLHLELDVQVPRQLEQVGLGPAPGDDAHHRPVEVGERRVGGEPLPGPSHQLLAVVKGGRPEHHALGGVGALGAGRSPHEQVDLSGLDRLQGVGGVQQFFEALGLARAPKVEINKERIELQGDSGAAAQMPQRQLKIASR